MLPATLGLGLITPVTGDHGCHTGQDPNCTGPDDEVVPLHTQLLLFFEEAMRQSNWLTINHGSVIQYLSCAPRSPG